jgi:sugar O-acyltransferase (sialic acid O-acetyltransferase NeuD family)
VPVTDFLLLGAGGHAKSVVEIRKTAGDRLTAYIDPAPCPWLTEVRHIARDAEADPADGPVVLGLGGVTIALLAARRQLVEAYCARGFRLLAAVHSGALVSPSATVGEGAHVLAGAIVQPGAVIGRAAIVNAGSLVEHDAVIAEGAHIAPGARVLGGARIGAGAMIGAGAVVLPYTEVQAEALVPANAVYRPAKPKGGETQ